MAALNIGQGNILNFITSRFNSDDFEEASGLSDLTGDFNDYNSFVNKLSQQ